MADLILAEKIAEIRQRLQSLQNPTILMPPHVDEAVEELQVTLEELRVAQEELEERIAELADANEILEQERRRYYELFNFTPGGCVVTTPTGVIREANRAIADMVSSSSMSWLGLARPSGRTAIASPPKISLAPLSPNRCQRRTTSGVMPPLVVPSQPSMGWTA